MAGDPGKDGKDKMNGTDGKDGKDGLDSQGWWFSETGSLQKKTHNILDIVSFNRVWLAIGLTFGGADGTRTRDPMRDRHVF